jgi:hypothetical protein
MAKAHYCDPPLDDYAYPQHQPAVRRRGYFCNGDQRNLSNDKQALPHSQFCRAHGSQIIAGGIMPLLCVVTLAQKQATLKST